MPDNEQTTHETLIWRGITCRISTTHNWKITGWSVITLRAPLDAPFPLGVGGYCRHGLEQETLEAAGGAVRFFKEWADREAHMPPFFAAVSRHRQDDLFK